MHELSIAMSILDSLEEEVSQRGCGQVEAVHIRIGGLSGVVPQALRSAYELAAEQTPFASSKLVIEEVPIVIHCYTCERDQPIESARWFCCPACNTPSAHIVSGRELEITALELGT
jgi:hydrogenase nickel incorporation protein HypA/HybF